MKRQGIEKIKQYILKRDNLVIFVLTGVLLMVIAWPVDGNVTEKNNVSDLWDRNNGER